MFFFVTSIFHSKEKLYPLFCCCFLLYLYYFKKFHFHLSFSQKKAREEILSVTGSIRNPNLSDRPNMPYVEAVIQEIQRLGNIAPFGLPHSTLKSGVWIGNTYIPKGNSYLVLTIDT